MPHLSPALLLLGSLLLVAASAEQLAPAKSLSSGQGEAEPAHPLWVFHWEELWKPEVLRCSIVLLLSGVLCAAAGIGGGGVFVAALMLVGRLSPHDAVPLSKCIVFFGALASLFANLRRTMSSPTPVMDLDVLRVVVPCSLVGTFLGVLLNWHAREKAIVMGLVLMLVFVTGLVLRTALQQREQELSCAALPASEPPRRCLACNPQEDVTESASMSGDEEELEEQRPLLTYSNARSALELVERHRAECLKNAPSRSDAVLAGYLLVTTIISGVLRFHFHMCRAEMVEGTNRGSCKHPVVMSVFGGRLEFWMSSESTSILLQLMNMSVPLWSCSAIAAYYTYLIHRVAKWPAAHLAAYQAVALTTGLLAGLLGVGGGLILSPFFLLTGLDPSVAIGTSATCVLFTSASTTFQYAFTDRIISSLAIVYGCVTLLASYLGTLLVHHLQDRCAGRKSCISFVVAAGVALSAALALMKLVGLVNKE